MICHPKINERLLLFTLAGIQFSHILDFMIMMPLGPELRRVFSISDAEFALLVSAYTLASGASGLAASIYIDRFERKRLLLTLYVLFGLSTLACALAPTYSALMGARVLAGAFGGVLGALSSTIVSDVVPFERRGRAMSVVMTSFSVSTVAGVPLGLWLATLSNWHAPFFMLAAICAVLAGVAAWGLPRLDGHLANARSQSPMQNLRVVLEDANHLRAFAFSACVFFAGFTVIPFITLYTTSTVGIRLADVTWAYLTGGVATLFTARMVGRYTDIKGKLTTYKIAAIAVCIPMLITTNLPALPLWIVVAVQTLFFVCMSSRMIPGSALIASAANPALRGTFMSLNGAVNSAAMGSATFIGGLLIGRDAVGNVTHYWLNGLLGVSVSLLSIWLASRLRMNG
jgi:predicted MFS family arabinose efflux permease